MIFFLLYLAKVTLLSGLLYGYYQLFLRNKRFHLYNRFFLLSLPVVALLLPFVHIPWSYALPVYRSRLLLRAIRPGDWTEPGGAAVTAPSTAINWHLLIAGAYTMVLCCFLSGFLRQLRYIKKLPKRYAGKRIDDIRFYQTSEPGTPFSFLRHLFWNDQLEIDTPRGQQIFRHELYHIRQKHSFDLLFLKSLLTLFWPIPFFHLVYREIRAIHEFMADDYAITCGDKYDYAELLVWQTIQQPSPALLHPFFNSSIKRRINMLTQNETNTSLFSRIMVLPVLFFLLCAFAIRLHPRQPGQGAYAGNLPGATTVVIDAGHGGSDPGALGANGTPEKDINLALALKIKELGPAYNVRVVLTREKDELSGGSNDIRTSLEYRTKIADEHKADLFISLHVNSTTTGMDQTGFNVYVSRDNSHYSQSIELGSFMLDALKGTYSTAQDLKEAHQHIYVLRQSAMPAITIMCGNIKNTGDLAFITNGENQEKIARDILQGIQHYQAEYTMNDIK